MMPTHLPVTTDAEIESVFETLGLATDEDREACRFDVLQPRSDTEITVAFTNRTEALNLPHPPVDA